MNFRIARRNTDSSDVVGRLNGERLAPRQPAVASWRRPATGARPVVDAVTAHRMRSRPGRRWRSGPLFGPGGERIVGAAAAGRRRRFVNTSYCNNNVVCARVYTRH